MSRREWRLTMRFYIGQSGEILTDEQFKAVLVNRRKLARIASLVRNPTTATPPWMLVRQDGLK
jgi:hypothetical protein